MNCCMHGRPLRQAQTVGTTNECVQEVSRVQNAHVILNNSQAPALLLTAVVHLLDCDGKPGNRSNHAIEATMQSRTEKFLLLPIVTNWLPSQRIPRAELSIPAGIQLADPDFHQPADVDAILGIEIFASLWRSGQTIRLSDGLIAQKTVRSDSNVLNPEMQKESLVHDWELSKSFWKKCQKMMRDDRGEVKCACTKDCRTIRCTCRKSGQVCTEMCKHCGEQLCSNFSTVTNCEDVSSQENNDNELDITMNEFLDINTEPEPDDYEEFVDYEQEDNSYMAYHSQAM
ncbi:hypothetical protein M0804_009914 [Polistes exclamans]|nr:hypothetical protein M0804_009914 [Polistes exclamans]